MRVINISLSLLLLMCSLSLSAQSPYSQDYVVLIKGDTLWGSLSPAADKYLAEGVDFQEEGRDSYTRYNGSEIKGFGYKNGRSFVSLHWLPVKNAHNQPEVFVKKLVGGKVDVYTWNKAAFGKSDYFLIKDSLLLHLAPPEKKLVERNGRKYNFYPKDYLFSLDTFLTEQYQFSVNPKLKYSEKEIQKTVLEYNRFTEDVHPVSIYKAEKRVEYNVMIGTTGFLRGNKFTEWRAAAYANFFNERSNSFFPRIGIIMQYDFGEVDLSQVSNDAIGKLSNFGLLNFVPLSIGYQGKPGFFQPYAYVGIGFVVGFFKEHEIENKAVVSNSHSFGFFGYPSLNLGMGTKVHIQENIFNIEVTPTFRGLIVSLGVTF